MVSRGTQKNYLRIQILHQGELCTSLNLNSKGRISLSVVPSFCMSEFTF